MLATKADKKTVQIVQGQRVYSGLYGGRYGIVAAVHGPQTPGTVGTMFAGVVSYGGSATVDVAFDTGVSKGIPEGIIRGVQWEIYEDVATADELLDLVLKGNQYQMEAKRKEQEAAERRAAERVQLATTYAHLTQGDGGKVGAANVRKELKKSFPGVKFSVTSSYNSISIKWTDGPTIQQVQAVTGKYEEGHYDGMQDMFVHSSDAVFAGMFGGVKYVSESRTTTPELEIKAWKAAYPNGLTCDGVSIPGDLPTDWRSKFHTFHPLNWIERTVRDFAG